MKSYGDLRGKVVVFLMDRGQTSPVVKKGGRRETVNATIMRLPLWDQIDRYTLNTNLRLLAMQANDPADPHFLRQQVYAQALAEIRTNGPFSLHGPVEELTSDDITGEKLLRFEGFVFCAFSRLLFFIFFTIYDFLSFRIQPLYRAQGCTSIFVPSRLGNAGI